ncbi:site-specific integrase [Fluviicola sp.]|uniref:site-specific integrase n=1 Tax=Fluviicola sp. TaxID=1917219 RepID=UPI0031E066DB
MKSNQKMSVMFWLFKSKADKKGLAPLYAKLTIEGEDVDLSIGRKVNPAFWDEKEKIDLDTSQYSNDTNFRIREAKRELERHFDVLCGEHAKVTPQMVKNRYQGKAVDWSIESEKLEREKQTDLIAVAKIVMGELEQKVESSEMKKSTLVTWQTSFKHITEFVKYLTGKTDTPIDAVNKDWIKAFIKYMTIERTVRLQATSTEKKIIHLKAFVEYAYDKGWIEINKISKFSYNPAEKKVKPLEYEQVLKIQEKDIKNERLALTRDLFVFQCYTGFAYSDMRALTLENFVEHGDEKKWLIRDRTKTMSDEIVPVLPVVEQIINKYQTHPLVLAKGVLLPVRSNQNYNGYLKEVGDLCGINRDLTTHLARHTFAHIMLNVCYLPMEDVGRMLGHRSAKSTVKYCQVGKGRLIDSMSSAQNKLNSIRRSKENDAA